MSKSCNINNELKTFRLNDIDDHLCEYKHYYPYFRLGQSLNKYNGHKCHES